MVGFEKTTLGAPITAAYRDANGDWVLTEPSQIKYLDTGIAFTFTFHHAGTATVVTNVIIYMAGTSKTVSVDHTSLLNADVFQVTYLLPY
jgi:hypothetical protein